MHILLTRPDAPWPCGCDAGQLVVPAVLASVPTTPDAFVCNRCGTPLTHAGLSDVPHSALDLLLLTEDRIGGSGWARLEPLERNVIVEGMLSQWHLFLGSLERFGGNALVPLALLSESVGPDWRALIPPDTALERAA